MEYFNAFWVGGLICVAGQLLIDLTPLTPARILTGYVVAGVVLSAVGLYGPLAELAKDFGYTGKWNYRLNNADQAAARYDRRRIERSLQVLQQLDLDLKGSRLPADLLLQKALCELGLQTGGRHR